MACWKKCALLVGLVNLSGYCMAIPPPEKFQTFLDEAVSAGRIPSAVALLARDDQVLWLGTAGEFSPEIEMRVNSIMPIASVGKMFTATAAMMLIENGKTSLEAPVSKYIPDFGSADHKQSPITIYHLLTHTSGLTVDGDDFWAVWDAHVGKTTTTQFAKSLVMLPRTPPGEKFEYGQTGAAYEVLAAVIEITSGQTLEEFMQENIFDPLTLNDSSFYVPDTQSDRLPAIYRRVDGILQLDRKQGVDFPRSTYFHGGGGVRTSAKDIHRFARMLLNGGELEGVRILEEETVQQMLTDQLGEKAPESWQKRGLSWGYGGAVNHSIDGTLNRYGWVGGGFARLSIDFPNRLIAFICAPMTPPGDNALLDEFDQLIYAD